MKAFRLLFVALMMTGSLGWAQDSGTDPDPEPQPELPTFTIAMFTPKIYLFDQAGQSCKTQIMNPLGSMDLQPSKLVFGALKLNWTGPSPLQLDYMKITLQSEQIPGGTQTMYFTGQELSYLWQGSPGLVELYPQDENQTTAPACNFEAGGVNLQDKNVAVTGRGQITVYATAMVDDQLIPLSSQVEFDFESAH